MDTSYPFLNQWREELEAFPDLSGLVLFFVVLGFLMVIVAKVYRAYSSVRISRDPREYRPHRHHSARRERSRWAPTFNLKQKV